MISYKINNYDIVGFATFTDFGGVPQYFHAFFKKIDPQPDKNAFVFNTYGFISGVTLKSFANLARSKSFNWSRNLVNQGDSCF